MCVFNRGWSVRSSQCRLPGSSYLVSRWLRASGKSVELLPSQGHSEQRQSATWYHFWSGWITPIDSISDSNISRWQGFRANWETTSLLHTGVVKSLHDWIIAFVLLYGIDSNWGIVTVCLFSILLFILLFYVDPLDKTKREKVNKQQKQQYKTATTTTKHSWSWLPSACTY